MLRWRIGRKRALLPAITQLSATLAARHKVWNSAPLHCLTITPAADAGNRACCVLSGGVSTVALGMYM